MTTDTPEVESFHRDLLVSVADRSKELGTTKQEAFTRLMLEELVEIGTINDFEICFLNKKLGRGIGRVNGYAISETDARVDLFTTIFRSDEEVVSLTQKDVTDASNRAARVFKFASGREFERMDPASEERLMFGRLHEAYSDITSLRILLLTNAKAPNAGRKPKLVPLEFDATTECYDLVRYFRWHSSSTPYEPISIDLADYPCGSIPCLKMPDVGADYGAYMAILPGTLLHQVYDQYGPRLMELNVRSFLQNRGKVNKGIRDTILNEPQRFLAYNNGISATAESLDVKDTSEGLVIETFHGLQVVNGGQTVAAIHRAGKVDRADLAGVFVQAKISVVSEELVEELVPRISRYANTQNKVNEADFSANNPFHVEMEQLSRKVWAPGQQSRWLYERARGQYEVLRSREGRTPLQRKNFDARNPKRQKFTKTDLAKYLRTWDELPHSVSRGAQKNFVVFMAVLDAGPKDWKPDQAFFRGVVAKAIIFKAAEAIARKHKFPAYRAAAICYTVAYVAYRAHGRIDLEAVWQQQGASAALVDAMTEWMEPIYERVVTSAAGKNVTEWAKKEACWHAVQRLELSLSNALAEEFLEEVGVSAPRDPMRTACQGLNDVMDAEAADWLKVFGWGKRTGELSDSDCDVAQSLAARASAGWQSLPSSVESQAGIRIYGLAMDRGVVSVPDE